MDVSDALETDIPGTPDWDIDTSGLQCIACGCDLPSVSDPSSVPSGEQRNGCDECSSFVTLHDRMRQASGDWEIVKSRRPNFRGRIEALNEYMEARMELANFVLQSTDDRQRRAWGPTQQRGSHPPGPDGVGPSEEAPPPSSVTKRARSQMSSPDMGAQGLSKRARVSIHGKGVQFDDATTVRDMSEQRSCDDFRRGSESYMRGRNAASEGYELVDTSGSEVLFKNFYQETWDAKRRQWISASPIHDPDEDKEATYEPEGWSDDLSYRRGVDEQDLPEHNEPRGNDLQDGEHAKASTTDPILDNEMVLRTVDSSGDKLRSGQGAFVSASADGVEPLGDTGSSKNLQQHVGSSSGRASTTSTPDTDSTATSTARSRQTSNGNSGASGTRLESEVSGRDEAPVDDNFTTPPGNDDGGSLTHST
ncbi:hypothetical protein BU24DRAFT_417739 [Aaosphaeria arxii CBS 175.79]|uniref:Uncharacterized protein n=1 Tax=Aaosphaeria arxii CBS 175.79 TaxID=1450172 RepID=A0A6A5Y9S9_9PLEO|nr:uncharacterized protein BU24DRAFT_417739 [Aaosphaeria arxii CBS 175.79]KAF2022089.1 hypothetical protein BU24DRAFT_417739 [Aaosphaeria arxii CBS 175.79]